LAARPDDGAEVFLLDRAERDADGFHLFGRKFERTGGFFVGFGGGSLGHFWFAAAAGEKQGRERGEASGFEKFMLKNHVFLNFENEKWARKTDLSTFEKLTNLFVTALSNG